MEHEDSDTEQALQLQRDEYARRLQARLQEEREISALIEDVYRDAWTDFYAEEPQRCAQLLTSLAATVPKRPAAMHMQTQKDDSDDQEMQVDSLETHDKTFVFSAESPFGKELKVQCDIQMAEVASFAYPKYESCTPAIDTILYDGDPRVLAFIPYADEPAFAEHVKTYTELYPELAWQSNWYDVDLNLIAADAYLRVDAAGLEPDWLERFKPRFLPSRATVELSLRKRDICGWGKDSLRPPPTTSDGLGLLAAVNTMTTVFCRSLTCNTAKCMTHEYVAEKTPDTPDDDQAAQIEQAREVVNKYRKLNYVFDIPGTPCGFDAATVGNPMRCLNDPMDQQKANVTAISEW
ncbi:hypothetical protein BD413DRAFT_466887 [Trametes elegans]|nr:hypothetical protein BD413DRAFT_466887 [Trametes elegans]